jgi:hypothetical protein
MKNKTGTLSFLKLAMLILSVAVLVISGCTMRASQNPTETPSLSFPTFEPTYTPVDNSSSGIVLLTPSSTPEISIPTLPAQPTESAATTNTPAPTVLPPTSVPPTSVPPTPLPLPTPIPGPVPVRINFATGATAGVLSGMVDAGNVQNFIVGASMGQPLIVSVDSPNHDITFSVTGLKDGVTLLSAGQKLSSWQTMLSVTQDYLIRVIGGSVKENFTLNVITPARIIFEAGSISANRHGTTPGGWDVSYILRAKANQKMDINLATTSGVAVLSVYGFQDGTPYLRYVVEAKTFSLILPSTQDYIVQVVPKAGQVVTYSLNIAIK